jgi:cytidyltransferase-like protein
MAAFDLLHIGHLRYIAWARSLGGGMLTATITADAFFPKYKGEHRPAFPQDVRAECLAALQLVDYVAIVNEPTACLAIHTIRPRIYAKGFEARGIIPDEVSAVERNGGRVCYMDKECESGQIYSSGRILSGEYLRSRNG